MMDAFTNYTNTAQNHAEASKHDGMHVLTNFEGKVLDYDARDGPITNKIMDASWLIDANLYMAAADAKSKGDMENYAALMDKARSPLYKDLLVEAAKQDKRVENAGYIAPSRMLLGKHTIAAAGFDQILQTAQEIVRQTKYQTKVSGVFYRTEKYQAVNIVNKISTNDLTTKGATDTQLPIGHKEIGDDQTPEITRPFFSTFEKEIFADSFHYGFGMREKSDAFINIMERMTSKVPGVMLRMKNEKIVAALNALTNTSIATKWNAYMTNHDIVAQDAALTVEDSTKAIEDFEGEVVHIMPREVQRWYYRNTQGRNVTSVKSTLPTSNRSGLFEWNDGMWFVDNAVTTKTIITLAKDAFIDHYIGPEIDVAYKDQMKPSNWEGRILFHFNGIQKKIDASAKRKTVLT